MTPIALLLIRKTNRSKVKDRAHVNALIHLFLFRERKTGRKSGYLLCKTCLCARYAKTHRNPMEKPTEINKIESSYGRNGHFDI